MSTPLCMLALYLTIAFSYCRGQTHIYNFEQFTDQKKLPTNTIRRIAESKDGLMWLATNKGLCLFDPVGVRSFLHHQENPSSIADNNLSSLYEDTSGQLWITTLTQGLSRYQSKIPIGSAFINYYHFKQNGIAYSINKLYDVIKDDLGNVWFGGQDTDLLCFNEQSGRITRLKLAPNSATPVSVYSFHKSPNGFIWIGTRHHGFYRFNPKTREAHQYNLNKSAQPWKQENGNNAFGEKDGVLWFGYYDFNLCKLDLRTGRIETDLLGIGKNNKYYDNAINCIAIRGDGTVLAGHDCRGLYSYDPLTRKKELIDWSVLSPGDKGPDRITDLYVDKHDNVWIGTERKGLILFSAYHNRFNLLYPANIKSIKQVEIIKENWWYRTDEGIGKYDPRKLKTSDFVSLKGLWVSHAIWLEKDIYLASYNQGVWRMDFASKTCQPLKIIGNDFGFREADCNTILPDTIDGNPYLWIGSWNSGVYRYSLKTRHIELFDISKGLPDNKVTCLGMDANRDIWIGTDGYGLLRVDDKEKPRFSRFLFNTIDRYTIPSNTVNALYRSRNGKLWMLSEYAGITEISHTNKKIQFNNIPNVNLIAWQNPSHIREDRNGNLWIAANEGLLLFDVQKKTTAQFNPGKGIVPPTYLPVKAFFAGSGKDVVLATDKGFIAGSAEKAVQKPLLPRAVTSAFLVNDEDFSHLLKHKKIHLNDDQNFFTFSITAPGFWDTEHLRFAYMLKGVDKTWRIVKDNFMVSYTDIKGGDYTFLARAGDYEGNWSAHVMDIPLYIESPYWQTKWFFIVVTLSVLFMIYAFFRFRLNQSRKINEMQLVFNKNLQQQLSLQAEKIKKQMALLEIEQKEKLESHYQRRISESELKAIRAQMNPHFIFNVLNSIESYILENNARCASRLVQKFAKLTRLILENSACGYVSVEREWLALKLYVELEAIRFNNSFDYEFLSVQPFDMKHVFIPPMLIQPLVENAIHHGMRQNLYERGKLQILVEKHEDYVYFIIIDNGVGFNDRRKTRRPFYKKTSMGLSTIKERLALLNRNQTASLAKLELQDLTEMGSSGTKAIIHIPLMLSSINLIN